MPEFCLQCQQKEIPLVVVETFVETRAENDHEFTTYYCPACAGVWTIRLKETAWGESAPSQYPLQKKAEHYQRKGRKLYEERCAKEGADPVTPSPVLTNTSASTSSKKNEDGIHPLILWVIIISIAVLLALA